MMLIKDMMLAEELKVIILFALSLLLPAFLFFLPIVIISLFKSARASDPILKNNFKKKAIKGILYPLIIALAITLFLMLIMVSGLFKDYGA